MTKTEMDIRSVLGPAGGSIRPLAAASDLFARRMFEERMDSEDIFLTKDIYPIVAVWLQKKPGATGRAIERLAARCWDLGDRGRLSAIAGKNLPWRVTRGSGTARREGGWGTVVRRIEE